MPPKPAAASRTPARRAAAARRGIQSVEVGGRLLHALAHQGRPMALKDLAQAAGMAAAKAHPYLVSYGNLGLIEQDEASGRYGLGPLAMQLGLISLQQLDPLALATPLLEELAQRTELTVAIAMWGNRGPTVVRVAPPAAPVHVSMRHGTVLSVRATASGRLFAAWLPKAELRAVLLAEGAGGLDRAFEAELKAIRAQGYGRAVDLAVRGISAVAVPVFDAPGRIALALVAIGPGALVDTSAASATVAVLRAAAQGLSDRLGARLDGAQAARV